jgi:hypothetical protein
MEIELKSELAERATYFEKEIKTCLVNIRINFLRLGVAAAWLKQGKRYKLNEPDAKNWRHYVALKMKGIEIAQLDNYADIAETIGDLLIDFDNKGKMIDVTRALDITRVVRKLPEPEKTEKAKELIESAVSEITPSGWKDTITAMKGGVPKDECDHSETELWSKCAVKGGCGRFLGKV